MKRNSKLLISVLSFSLLAALFSVEAKQGVKSNVGLNVSTLHENAVGRNNVLVQNKGVQGSFSHVRWEVL